MPLAIGFTIKCANSPNAEDFLDEGGCETMLNLLRRYGATDREIVANCCAVVCFMIWSLRRSSEYLGSIGFCAVFIKCLAMHVGDALISELGLAAIALLGDRSNANKYLLSTANCCDVISQVGYFGFNIRHERSVFIASNYCAAVEVLCEAINVRTLMDSGCCQLLAALMKLHLSDTEFATAGMKALCGLLSLSPSIRADLIRFGACESIVEVYTLHGTTCRSIIIDVCEAILHLSLDQCNADQIGNAGLCKVLVDSLLTHLLWVDNGSEIATTAVLNLVESGPAAGENQYRFVDAGIMEAFQLTLQSELLSFRTLDNVMKLFDIFAVEDIQLSQDSLARRNVLLDHQQYCSVYEYLTSRKEPIRTAVHIAPPVVVVSSENEEKCLEPLIELAHRPNSPLHSDSSDESSVE